MAILHCAELSLDTGIPVGATFASDEEYFFIATLFAKWEVSFEFRFLKLLSHLNKLMLICTLLAY